MKNKLENNKGRFTTITVSRVKTGCQQYCAKISRVTDKTVKFIDVNTRRELVVPLANVVGVGRD